MSKCWQDRSHKSFITYSWKYLTYIFTVFYVLEVIRSHTKGRNYIEMDTKKWGPLEAILEG
jgi:hypothetical protein